ncbi:MAG TPA: HTTM domain-containing protein [Terriglobales bacterium]|nr:HTTM domain-containing protein [Terriglobales bacterium]
MRSALNNFREWLSVERRLVGVSLMRVGLGTIIIAVYSQHLLQFRFLWGNNGVVPYSLFKEILSANRELSLFAISPSLNTFIFILGIGSAVLFTIGLYTRISSVAFYICTFSLYTRNPFLLDGGDNLLYLLAFYMMFTDCGAHFSFDSARRRSSQAPGPFRALLHNFGILAIITQLTLLYFTSAFYKVQGHMWQDGTAVYYILRSAEFNMSSLSHIIYDNGPVLTVITWSVMINQLAWVFWIWHPKLRWALVASTVVMHFMIAYFMGLFWFSAVMISAECIVLSDSDYSMLGKIFNLGFAGAPQMAGPQRQNAVGQAA